MHASFRYASRSCSCFVRAKFEQVPALNRHLRSLTMSANVLSSSENLQPAASTKQGAAAAMEPPSKQPRLEQPSTFKVKLLNEDAKAPQRGSAAAAGYDLCSSEDTVIPARGRKLVKTGISIATPPGTYGRVAPRSGLAVNHFIDVGAGVIDEDYRGEVRVLLFNHEDKDFTVNKGDRIAQLVLECIKTPPVEVVDDLDATDRGAGGFGSTGGYTGNTGPAN